MAEQPMNPLAGAPGPGMYSTRTDQLKFQSPEYGAGVENAANKAGAPLASTPNVRPTSLSNMGMAPSQASSTSLFATSQRPEEAVTAGIDIGDGVGSSALGMRPQVQEKLSDILATMLPYDDTGEVEILYQRALARGM